MLFSSVHTKRLKDPCTTWNKGEKAPKKWRLTAQEFSLAQKVNNVQEGFVGYLSNKFCSLVYFVWFPWSPDYNFSLLHKFSVSSATFSTWYSTEFAPDVKTYWPLKYKYCIFRQKWGAQAPSFESRGVQAPLAPLYLHPCKIIQEFLNGNIENECLLQCISFYRLQRFWQSAHVTVGYISLIQHWQTTT